MNKVIHKSTGIVFGLTLALFVGRPALADDTELLVVTPPDPSQVKPNVMFILDTSGSMSSVQIFGALYNQETDYSEFGECDRNYLYYTEAYSTMPACGDTNTRSIRKEAWNCLAASAPISNVGEYTGVLAQYRPSIAGVDSDGLDSFIGPNQWQPLQPGNESGDVECEADRGKHGSFDLRATTDVYATNAQDPDGDGWTSDSSQEVSWGSSGVNVTYTVYDGNYLNYLKDPATRYLSRSAVMKEVVTTVLNSVDNMNVGLMRFNGENGGTVIQAPVDLDTNRTEILARVDSLDTDSYTTLAETIFESALLWQGLPAHYGELFNKYVTDPRALASSSPEKYLRPEIRSCAKNFNVLLSDGEPSRDAEVPELLGQLPGYATVMGSLGCTGTGDGACLPDVAEYLSRVDIDPTLEGHQSVITHTIGFTQNIPILEETARRGGGQYLLAEDTDSLLQALSAVVSQINQRALSFSAPAVSVNSFNRTRNLNDLYITMFGARGAAHWPGNLKHYRISNGTIVDAQGNEAVDPETGFFYDSARSYWTDGAADGNDVLRGGAAHQIPDPGVRRLFTDNGLDNNLSGATNAISTANIGAFSAEDFGLSASSSTTVEEMIRWMRGEDVKDIDGDPTTTVRYAMGDPLHSRPATIVYGGTSDDPEAVVFTATNDGYLHAVDAQTGVELWSYVPKDLLPRMAILFDDPEMNYKLYGIDGDIVPVIRDLDRDGRIEPLDGDRAYILFGLRRGGSKYRMLDVTNRSNPVLIWERVLANGGESWSPPVVTRMAIDGAAQNAFQAVAVFGGGYDRVHDTPAYNPNPDLFGTGIHVLDLITGETLWYAGSATSDADLRLEKMTKAIPTRIKVLDINGDSFADRMYAADLGGQVWRFDISNGNPAASLVAGGVIARLGAEGLESPTAADTRRFYNSPDVAIFNDSRQNRRFISISIGSGYRAHPLDLSAADRFYSIRDPYVFNALTQQQYDNFTPFTETDLVDVSGRVDVTITEDDAGWMLSLPDNQMILTESMTFANEIFFVSFSPDSQGAAACNVGVGKNYLYRVSVFNGDPIMDDFGNIPTGSEDDARRTQLAQGGIAPSPQFLFPSPKDADCSGADCSPPPLGCIGVECFDPGFENNPVRTLWTQDGIE